MNWQSDWSSVIKDNVTKILILLPNGNITTGCFFWYVEYGLDGSLPISYWYLHDLIRDVPLDEDGPVEQSSLKWAPFP